MSNVIATRKRKRNFNLWRVVCMMWADAQLFSNTSAISAFSDYVKLIKARAAETYWWMVKQITRILNVCMWHVSSHETPLYIAVPVKECSRTKVDFERWLGTYAVLFESVRSGHKIVISKSNYDHFRVAKLLPVIQGRLFQTYGPPKKAICATKLRLHCWKFLGLLKGLEPLKTVVLLQRLWVFSL